MVSDAVIGVQLSYFDEFIEQNGGRDLFQGLTTREVCEQFIVAQCQATCQSVCQQLRHRSPVVGAATWFVSHTWGYPFLDTVEATRSTLVRLLGEAKAQTTVVWFDLFSLLQTGDRTDIPFQFLSTTFLGNVKAIGNVLMVMLPWDNPTTLTRAWCVFEAYACLHTGSRFEVAMTSAENDRFLQTIRSTHNIFYKMLAQINSSKSVATKPSDQQLIHRAIREEIAGGFTGLDRAIFVVLDNWMIQLLKREITAANDDAERAEWQDTLAGVFQNTGKLGQAEPLFLECLATKRRVLGDVHLNTIGAINNLAALYNSQGRYDEAEPLFLESMAASRRVLGDDHPGTFISMNNLAMLYNSQGRHDQAKPLFLESLAVRRRVLGDVHPSTLRSINNLAMLYNAQGRYDEAEPLFLECLTVRRRVSGDAHPDTLILINNLAALYNSQGRYDEAEPLFLEILATRRRVLGDVHPDTLTSMNNLAISYNSQGRYDQAEPLLLECLTGRRRVLGEDHPSTLISMYNLAVLYKSQGQMAKARPLFDEYKRNKAHR